MDKIVLFRRGMVWLLAAVLMFGQLLTVAANGAGGDDGEPIVLIPTHDTFVEGGDGRTGNTHGGDSQLQIADTSGNPPNERIIYLKFDLDGIDETAVNAATLRLYNTDTRYNRVITAYKTAGDETGWLESTLNWTNAPGAGSPIMDGNGNPASAVIIKYSNTNEDKLNGASYYDLDVSSYVLEALAEGASEVSIVIQSNGFTSFASKSYNQGAFPPKLVLDRESSGMTVALTALGDTFIEGQAGRQDRVNGTGVSLQVAEDTHDNARRIYVQFDLSGVDLDAVKSARLELYYNDTRYERLISAYKTAGNDSSWSESMLNWSNAPLPGNPILDSQGNPSTVTTVKVAASDAVGEARREGAAYYGLDVLSYLKEEGALTNGIVSIVVKGSGFAAFASKEFEGGAFPPTLVLSDKEPEMPEEPVEEEHKPLEAGGRSSLYPEDWYPGYADTEGRFLHDFSYAGYRMGQEPPTTVAGSVYDVTQAPYLADNTGTDDVTSIIQAAINDAGAAGGGVVYLPAGTYRIKPQGLNNEALKLNKSGVVLRGAGPDQTFLFNDEANMRSKEVIKVSSDGAQFLGVQGTETWIRYDLTEPTTLIPVQDVAPFEVGDWVTVSNQYTADFIAEHNMTDWWNLYEGNEGVTFYRKVVGIDAESNTLMIDIPTRYPLKVRDYAKVYKLNPPVTEVGVEHLSIGNVENLKSGLAEGDNAVEGTAGYEASGATALRFFRVADAWARNVHTYRPPTNSENYDYHILSRGIAVTTSRNVTVLECDMRKPLYRGAGGNGYLYDLVGNDNLILNSYAEAGRHNYTFSHMRTNGNVIRNSESKNPTHVIDFHQYLSASNLLDGMILNGDSIEANVRNSPSASTTYKHGVTTSQTVIWNTYAYAAHPKQIDVVVDSRQHGYGYVIGTQGAATQVKVTPTLEDRETAPVDFTEGIGQGELLQPGSLYLDQLARRDNRLPVELRSIAVNGTPISNFQSGKLIYDVALPLGTTEVPEVTAAASVAGASVNVTLPASLPGEAVIHVVSPDSLKTADYRLQLTVADTAAELRDISVQPDRTKPGWKFGLKIDMGDSAWLRTTGMMTNGTEADLTDATFEYESDKPEIVSVDQLGQITALTNGEANITVWATLGGVTRERTIKIVASIPVHTELDTLPIVDIRSSGDDGNVVENVLDADYDTRWSASGEGQWMLVDLGEPLYVEAASLAFFSGDKRKTIFEIEVSVDGLSWTTVYDKNPAGNSSGVSTLLELFPFHEPRQARYIRIIGYGNSVNAWNSVSELRIHPYLDGYTPPASPPGFQSEQAEQSGQAEQVGQKSIPVMVPDTADTVLIESELATIKAPGQWFDGLLLEENQPVAVVLGPSPNHIIELLDKRTKQAIGDRPIVDIRLQVGGEPVAWSNPDAPLTVSIPYTLSEQELANPKLLEKLTIWRIGEQGELAPIPNAKYDAESGKVVFLATELSRFAIVLEPKTFNDLGAYEWARDAVEVLASRGVIAGKSDMKYAPSEKVNRADFTVLIIRALGLSATTGGSFPDMSEDDYYYEAVSIARKLGIVNGVGDDTFKPSSAMTRQEMMVVAARALKAAGKLNDGHKADLAPFLDTNELSPYAKESVALLVGSGMIQGNTGLLNPRGLTSRAEAAALLYRLMKIQ